jgi:hypothetical protein
MWEKFPIQKSSNSVIFREFLLMRKKMLDISFKLAYFSDTRITGDVTKARTSLPTTEVRMKSKVTLKRLRAVFATILLAAFANLAISYASSAFSTQKSGSSILPNSPRPKSGSSILPNSPRPKSGSSILPNSPRP